MAKTEKAKKPIIRIALDPGYSSMKVVCNGYVISLPCDVIDNTGNEEKFLSEKNETYKAINIFGKNYLVGEYARKLLLEDNRQKVQDINQSVLEDYERFKSEYFEISAKAAIGIALIQYCELSQAQNHKPVFKVEDLDKYDIFLAVAVPHAVYDMGRKGPSGNMREKLFCRHEYGIEIGTKTYELNYSIRPDLWYKFQSQVVSALVGSIEDELGEPLDVINNIATEKPLLVIDGGYRTVGIFKLSQIDSVESAESNPNFAMSVIDKLVAEKMKEYGRSDIKSYNIQQYYDTQEQIGVNIDGESHFITINKERDEIIAQYCEVMIDYLKKNFNMLSIKQILITGGTGAAYFDTFLNYIDTHPEMYHLKGRVHLARYKFLGKEIEPMYAIVIGLYKQFGRALDIFLEEDEEDEEEE